MENNMKALRDHLFDTLERLKDEKKPMDVDRAKMVCAVASKIIETAKVEVKAAEVADAVLSDFLETEAQSALSALRAELSRLNTEMGEYVGANVPHRLVATPAGTVTLSHDSAKAVPIVRVFDPEGEEVRS